MTGITLFWFLSQTQHQQALTFTPGGSRVSSQVVLNLLQAPWSPGSWKQFPTFNLDVDSYPLTWRFWYWVWAEDHSHHPFSPQHPEWFTWSVEFRAKSNVFIGELMDSPAYKPSLYLVKAFAADFGSNRLDLKSLDTFLGIISCAFRQLLADSVNFFLGLHEFVTT